MRNRLSPRGCCRNTQFSHVGQRPGQLHWRWESCFRRTRRCLSRSMIVMGIWKAEAAAWSAGYAQYS
jgi:hypothetical protein